MTLYQKVRVGGLVALVLFAACFVILGNQRQAQAAGLGSSIVDNVFCTLENFPTTDVFSTECAPSVTSGSITVIKVVTGTSTPSSDFEIGVASSTQLANSPQPGSSTGTTYGGLNPGDVYIMSETAGAGADLSDYAATFSGDCNSSGSITVVANENVTCTITNAWNPPAPTTSDLGITKTVDNATPNTGDTVTYTLTVSDVGQDATGVTVSDLLPSGLTFVSTTTSDTVGVYDPVGGVWTIGDVSNTTPVTLHIMATVNSGQSNGTVITNTASVTAGDTSTDSANNTASVPVTVTIPSGGGGSGGTSVTQTVVVKPSNMQGWAFVNDETNGPGTGMMVFGPATSPLGVGSAQLTATSTTDGEVLESQIDLGTLLSDLTTLTYSTYQDASNPSNAQAIALQFNVAQNATDPSAGWQGRIVYEPYNNNGGTVPQGSWNTWDALDGGNAKWWFSDPGDFGGNCPQASPCTLSSIIALYPEIGINDNPALGAVVLKAGSGWTSFQGDVDDLVIGTTDGTNATTTTYDMEPNVSDIGVTKTVDNANPNLGDTVTYTITVNDTGDDATGVAVSDLLPSGLTFVSTTTPDTVGVYDPVSGIWAIGDVSSTTPVTLHIMATVNGGQSNGTAITNTAAVSAGDTSTDTTNDSASAPVTVTIPSNPGPSSSGGGGGGNGPIAGSFGGSGGGNGPIPQPQGEVLGASTSTLPESCSQYLTAFIRTGKQNDVSQVERLQTFLNTYEGDSLTVNGVYDAATLKATEAFQAQYASDVLTPWGLNGPTGYVYLTTRKEVNEIYCHFTQNFPLSAQQQAIINASRTGGSTGTVASTIQTNLGTPSGQENSGTPTPTDQTAAAALVNMNTATTSSAPTTGSATNDPFAAIGNWFKHLFHH